ncbi:MAG: hypothetical protein JWP76_1831 [Dactylosporangium sp.]|nr:hypothetical protein [Dactylosporangium sp.]
MSRRDVRTGVAAYFGGSTVTAADWYQPTPLTALGLAGVKAYYQNRFDDHEYRTTLDPATRTGAIMCVHLSDDAEKRLAIGGILDAPFNVSLFLFFLTLTPSQANAQADRDALLEAIRARLRADPTVGMGVNSGSPTIVTQAGEGPAGITTSTPLPYFEPPARTMQEASISFTVNTYPAG